MIISFNKNAIQIFTHNKLVQCIISLMTSPPIIRPATPGTKELLAGISSVDWHDVRYGTS